LAAAVLATVALGGCGEDDPEASDQDTPSAAEDAAAGEDYCALVEEFQASRETFAEEAPDGTGGAADAKALDRLKKMREQVEGIAEVAPGEYADVWSDWGDGLTKAETAFADDMVDPASPPDGMNREDAEMTNLGVVLEVLQAMAPSDEDAAVELGDHAREECDVDLG